jgi:membrane protease YdiL (CAAX protease family)
MTASGTTSTNSNQSKSGPWWEIVIVMIVYLGIGITFPGLKQLLAIPLILYMVIESWLRHRTWAENGFSLRTIPSGLRKTFIWFLLVAFFTQALFIFGGYFFLPDLFTHLVERVPMDISSLNASLFISIAIATFLEELLFRALFQNRLSAFVSPAKAIFLVSLVFGIAHFSPGTALIVFVDVISVFVDSLIYGIIYERSRNVFVSWIPHYIADIFSIIVLILIK